jgi:hypothetical protein
MFVAVGYGGRRVRSLDGGHTWVDDQELSATGGDDMQLLRTVAWGPPGFVALGWRSMTSGDAKSWTDHGANIGQWLGAVVYAKNTYVAVGGYGMRAVSTDGVTWTDHSIDTIATHAGDALVYADVMGGLFVSANDNGARSYSSDGMTWTYAMGASGATTTHLAFGNGIFLGVGGTAVVTSTDGANWTLGAALPASADGLVFGGGHFTAVASGRVFTSQNGASWKDNPVANLPSGPLAYGDGTYVLATNTELRRSSDGIAWDPPYNQGSANGFSWVTYGPGP